MGVEVGGTKDFKSEPNVVPLCDVLLVLLIIFMVVTPMLQKGVDVLLPEALNTINQPDPSNQVVVAIKANSDIYLNQDRVTKDNLKQKIEEAFENRTDKTIYLKADNRLEYGEILPIINIIREAGIEIIGIVTEKKTLAAE
ncbi:MAG: ExbD/TolR family protein [Candidatus Aminicenantia bacterium]